MKRLLVLGGGTAGTMVVNKLRPPLEPERVADHGRRPGRRPPLPAGLPAAAVRDLPTRRTRQAAAAVHPGRRRVRRRRDRPGRRRTSNTVVLDRRALIGYDYLVIATGMTPRPDQTPGHGRRRVAAAASSTSTPSTARSRAARQAAVLDGGRLVVHMSDMPIKCPVAPLEFTFLAEAYFGEQGMRDRVDITYVTPLEGAFTKPIAPATSAACWTSARSPSKPTSWSTASTRRRKKLVSFDEREIDFDLLVTVPLNMGADFVARSGSRRRAQLRARSTSTPCCPRRTTTSSRSATPRTSRPPRPARSRTSRSRSSSTTSSSTSTASR